MIEVRHLKKSYPGITPLKDVNATIERGEVISIIGPSGTGKSTFLRCLNLLETPTEGEITFNGQTITDRKCDINALRQKIGMVFQSFNLFAHLTIAENIMLAPVSLKKVSRQAAYDRALELLRQVGLADKALSYPDELSGGQKQRAAIARTLAMEPEVVLFDEPTSALDPTMVGEVLSVIRSLAKRGLTMLIVTHEMKFARDVSTRILYMDEGIIYEDGTPEQIFTQPKRDKTRRFIERLKVFERTLTDRNFDFIGLNTEINAFCRRHQVGAGCEYRLQTIFEELIMQILLPNLPEKFQLDFSVEYSEEKEEAKALVRWSGEPFDPLKEGDGLSVALIRNAAALAVWKRTEGEFTNEIEMNIK